MLIAVNNSKEQNSRIYHSIQPKQEQTGIFDEHQSMAASCELHLLSEGIKIGAQLSLYRRILGQTKI